MRRRSKELRWRVASVAKGNHWTALIPVKEHGCIFWGPTIQWIPRKTMPIFTHHCQKHHQPEIRSCIDFIFKPILYPNIKHAGASLGMYPVSERCHYNVTMLHWWKCIFIHIQIVRCVNLAFPHQCIHMHLWGTWKCKLSYEYRKTYSAYNCFMT